MFVVRKEIHVVVLSNNAQYKKQRKLNAMLLLACVRGAAEEVCRFWVYRMLLIADDQLALPLLQQQQHYCK